MKLKKLIINFLMISTITLFSWIVIDFSVTLLLGVRGFSQFFESDKMVGHINKANFSGNFGGPLDDFYSSVNIDKFGARKSSFSNCPSPQNKIIFLGDSVTAGFEVNDDQTFVSIINKNCGEKNIIGYNFGVRAHDTHSVIGNYLRVGEKIDHNSVYYLISLNDLSENLQIYHYKNLVKRFGRIFNGLYVEPNTNFFEKIYFSFRLLISDKFYLTTKILTFKNLFKNKKNYYKDDIKIKLSIKEIQKLEYLYELILKLNFEVKKKQSNLSVAFSPNQCFIRDKILCLLHEQWMIKKINENKNDFKIHSIIKEVYELNKDEEFSLETLRFKRDLHLSIKGHKLIGDLIYNFYENNSN